MNESNREVARRWGLSDSVNEAVAVCLSSQPDEAITVSIDTLIEELQRRGASVPRRKVTAALRALENVGLGKLISGRRNDVGSRFESPLGISAIGHAALRSPKVDPESNMLLHQFNIRPGVEITLRLPVDLTEGEARRLARHIENLPFAEDEA